MYIDALLADGADGRALVADLYFFALALKAALTLSSWSTSPCTLPRGAGCLGQKLCLRWPVSCVLDPKPISGPQYGKVAFLDLTQPTGGPDQPLTHRRPCQACDDWARPSGRTPRAVC